MCCDDGLDAGWDGVCGAVGQNGGSTGVWIGIFELANGGVFCLDQLVSKALLHLTPPGER